MIHHGIFPSGRSPGHSFSGCSRLGPIPPMRLCPKSATTLHISGLSEVAGKYEAVLLDQFGVLHDGRKAYSQRTLEAVRALSDMGIKVFIISNSSRRSSGTLAKLQKLGFDAKWFVGAVTSGDMTHLHLEQRPSPWWQALGNRCIHFTWSTRGAISLEGMGLEVTTDPSEADFLLAHGTEALGRPQGPAVEASLEDMRSVLRRSAERGLPMIVANPDLVTVDGSEGLAIMPGTLAKWYSEMGGGGNVHLMGKPAPVIYESAMKQLGVDAHRVLAIGDSLEHDIAGAASAGIDSLFIAAGIHADELEVPSRNLEGDFKNNNGYSIDQFKVVSKRLGVCPTYSTAYLEW